jgi:hypothetical protein
VLYVVCENELYFDRVVSEMFSLVASTALKNYVAQCLTDSVNLRCDGLILPV